MIIVTFNCTIPIYSIPTRHLTHCVTSKGEEVLRGMDSLPRKRAEYCRFHAINNFSSVSRNVTNRFASESSTRIPARASSKRNRISFRSIDRGEVSRGALLQPLLSAAIRRSQRLRRSYRERLIAQLSRRIARSKIIFIHRNTLHTYSYERTILNEPKSD